VSDQRHALAVLLQERAAVTIE